MSLFMETTKIDVGKTVSEIQHILGAAGCSGVMTLYENGEVMSVCFQISHNGKKIAFNLPCRWESIYEVIKADIKRPREGKMENLEAQSKRIAWRQILRWVQAQLALVETDMVEIQEVFMPYMQVGLDGQTLYQKMEANNFKQLESPK